METGSLLQTASTANKSGTTCKSVGNYAIGFDWNDGHNSDIHSFNDLRAMGERAAAQGVEDV